MAVGQVVAVLALGLGAVEQPLSRKLAAAQRHKAAGLLPAGVLRVKAVVEQHLKAELHVGGYLVEIPQRPECHAADHAAQQEPSQRHAAHKAHTGEDEQKHQCAAHIRGHLVVQGKDHAQMGRQEQDGGDAAQIAVFLEPRQLLGQHQRQGQLDDLGRLHLYRQERKIQPRPVAGVVLDAQRRHQQQNENQSRQKYPFPVFGQVVEIHLRHQQVQDNAQQQRGGLDGHQTPCVHVAGGAGHHEDAEKRCRRAKRQQHQIRLAQHIRKKVA